MSEDGDWDAQSFYSMLPDGEEAPWHKYDAWPEADVYTVLPLPAAHNTTSSASSPAEADGHSTTTATELQDTISAIDPAVPAHFQDLREDRKSALLLTQRHLAASDARDESHTRLTPKRPSTSGGEHISTRNDAVRAGEASLDGCKTRRKTISARPQDAHVQNLSRLESGDSAGAMNRTGLERDGDLFFELANDQAKMEAAQRPMSHDEPLQSRLSSFNKRRSLPPDNGAAPYAESRPKSSGHLFGRLSTPRVDSPSDVQRHVNRYSSSRPGRATLQADDAASVSSASRSGVLYRPAPAVAERSPLQTEQMRSSDMPRYGRRRPSFGTAPWQIHNSRAMHLSGQLQGAYSRSAAETSEQKQSLPDSASVDSQTADTVWDELDDLKSRIKKLELTGKLPPTSGAAVSTEQSDRPRTATTAPTTIDSSPKHQKPDSQPRTTEPELEPITPEVSNEIVVGGPDAANIHPNLHAALAKAKSILDASLYRSLEATAADALQLAAMTGSAGPQGTALTAAAIINGVTVSDRHVRRKADTMCRNLTDLVLALCEGKSEPSHVVSSPIIIKTPLLARSPSLRHSRSSLEPPSSLVRNRSRPMSRLEARRASHFGSQAGGSVGHNPLESGEDISASEQESTVSGPRVSRDSLGQGRAVSRLQAARLRRYDEGGDDDDPTTRPPSRATTDFVRTRALGGKEYSTPRRSPSFREHLAARRASQEGGLRELSRTASLASDSGRSRRFLDPNTPPVLEEEGAQSEYSSSQSKRRITSLGPYSSRQLAVEMPSRTSSLYQRRQQVLVE